MKKRKHEALEGQNTSPNSPAKEESTLKSSRSISRIARPLSFFPSQSESTVSIQTHILNVKIITSRYQDWTRDWNNFLLEYLKNLVADKQKYISVRNKHHLLKMEKTVLFLETSHKPEDLLALSLKHILVLLANPKNQLLKEKAIKVINALYQAETLDVNIFLEENDKVTIKKIIRFLGKYDALLLGKMDCLKMTQQYCKDISYNVYNYPSYSDYEEIHNDLENNVLPELDKFQVINYKTLELFKKKLASLKNSPVSHLVASILEERIAIVDKIIQQFNTQTAIIMNLGRSMREHLNEFNDVATQICELENNLPSVVI